LRQCSEVSEDRGTGQKRRAANRPLPSTEAVGHPMIRSHEEQPANGITELSAALKHCLERLIYLRKGCGIIGMLGEQTFQFPDRPDLASPRRAQIVDGISPRTKVRAGIGV
jgi:hypothetical protein